MSKYMEMVESIVNGDALPESDDSSDESSVDRQIGEEREIAKLAQECGMQLVHRRPVHLEGNELDVIVPRGYGLTALYDQVKVFSKNVPTVLRKSPSVSNVILDVDSDLGIIVRFRF